MVYTAPVYFLLDYATHVYIVLTVLLDVTTKCFTYLRLLYIVKVTGMLFYTLPLSFRDKQTTSYYLWLCSEFKVKLS